eukprot:4714590-Prymnesium_polylepis.1
MIVDELRQLGLVARRRSASTWLDCRHEGSGTTRSELGVCARRWGCTRSAVMKRARGWRGAPRRPTWRERQQRVGRERSKRRPGRLA